MDPARRGEFEKIALEVRKDVVRMLSVAHSGGFKKVIGIVDILVYLYWDCMNVFPAERNRQDRDRFVLGKGVAAPALYACLARRGYFSREELWSYGRLGATLQGFADIRTPGVDAPWCHGGAIGIARGIASSFGDEGRQRVFCLVDEDDMTCGAAWESVVSLPSEGAERLVLLIDSTTQSEKTASGLEIFGWDVVRADGGDFDSISEAFGAPDRGVACPRAIIVLNKAANMTDMGFQEGDAPMSKDDVDNAINLLESGTRGGGGPDGGK